MAHKGWYAAVDLRAGDILVLVNGEYVTLEKTQHEILEAPITVYNFEVEDYHTYYVGTDGVLVHNDCKQQLVAGSRDSYSARVSVGGEQRHLNSPHAHVFYKNNKIASVNSKGKIIVGKLDKAGRQFVKKNMNKIAKGIERWWYHKP